MAQSAGPVARLFAKHRALNMHASPSPDAPLCIREKARHRPRNKHCLNYLTSHFSRLTFLTAFPGRARPNKSQRGLGRAFSRNIGPEIGYSLVACRTFMFRENARPRPRQAESANKETWKARAFSLPGFHAGRLRTPGPADGSPGRRHVLPNRPQAFDFKVHDMPWAKILRRLHSQPDAFRRTRG